MRHLILLFLLTVSMFSLTLEESKHLLNRTTFGYTKTDLEKFQTFSKKEAVEYILTQAQQTTIEPIPENIKEVSIFHGKIKNLSREERKKLRKARNLKMNEIKNWWYKMIFNSQYGFREKMTLFWHNHFVSEYRVVKSPLMMFEQNMLYRRNALGDFDHLLHLSSMDMAMLVYLDSNSNKKSHPNENYARELLELFTLGEGNYTEEDIKQAARAFTGLRVNKKTARVKLVKKHHDYGTKTFMGYRGNFIGKDIINIILKQKQTATFITQKLYSEFISTNHNKQEINRIADIFRNSGYNIAVLMKELLLSKEFWDINNRGNMIKSPVEFIASLVKNLNLQLREKDYKFIFKSAKDLGQDLFNPPSVKGWDKGKAWIDSSSLINRTNFIKVATKRRLKQKNIKELNIKNFKQFNHYFYPVNVTSNIEFKNKKRFYQALLANPIYNLK